MKDVSASRPYPLDLTDGQWALIAPMVPVKTGGRLVLAKARMAMPSIALVWADGGHAGTLVDFARRWLYLTPEIVKKPKGQHTFEVLPRRWVVERTLSWLVRGRRPWQPGPAK